ncbi:unnamed protein product, partial [Mesorhabditis spiculigera]
MAFAVEAPPDDSRDIRDHPVPLWRRVVSLVLLTLLHAMTFADRFGISGVLSDIIDFYDISDSTAGLLSTLFMAATIVGSPLAGILWIGVMLAASFVPKNMFWLFLTIRCIDGFSDNIVYSCAPSLISDYFFIGKYRNYAFMCFYYGLNFGGQFGAIFASIIAEKVEWQWSLRFVPALTLILWALVLLIVVEPPRIKSGSTKKLRDDGALGDVKYLLSIKTYIFIVLARGMAASSGGVSGWWNNDLAENTMKWYKNESMDKFYKTFDHMDYKE